MEIIEHIGTSKALELLSEAAEKHAAVLETEFKSAHELDAPLQKGVYVYRTFMRDLGTETEIVGKSAGSVDIRAHECPIYGAYLDIGLECAFWMKGLCTNIVLPSIESALRRFDDRLALALQSHRSSAEECCIVRVRLNENR